MSPKRREERAITIRLTDDEYSKIERLAEMRHMNPTEYTRNAALGNRIKPTVVIYEEQEKNEVGQKGSVQKNNLFGEKSEGERNNIKRIEDQFFSYEPHEQIDENMFKNISLKDISE